MQAYLILANGRILKGKSLGCQGTTVGEVVFATGMVGFEETLTDPSYYGQIITQTYPLIGNYGMNSEDKESGKIWAKGYIVREACTTPSNFRSEETLDTFLKENGIIGIEGIDTRSLTRILRESGVMNGAITTEFDPETEPEKLAALMPIIKAYAVTGAVDAVTCTEPQCFAPTAGVAEGEEPLHIALLDLGCKKNIVRCLCKRGCRVTVLPASTTLAELKALAPDGLMLSNGPGDPAENVQVIRDLGVDDPTAVAGSTVRAGIFSSLLMAFIYIAVTIAGTQSRGVLEASENGGTALAQIAQHYLGSAGLFILAATVTLACLKTAVGLITSCAETFSALFPDGPKYRIWAIIFSLVSLLFANLGLSAIISYSLPVLMFLYPLSIALIALALLGKFFGHDRTVYCWTIGFTLIAAVYDLIIALPESVFNAIHGPAIKAFGQQYLPFADLGLGWICSTLIGAAIGLILHFMRGNRAKA